MRKPSDRWPSLPYTEWQATCETIHMYAQVAGKIRLCLAPPEPQWGHVALYVTARGLTTSPIPYDGRTFEIIFDFIGHSVVIAVSDGQTRSIALVPRSVAAFYQEVVDGLREAVDETLQAVTDVCRRNHARTTRVAADAAERERIWLGRKSAFGAMGRISANYYVQDGVIPRTKLPEVIAEVEEIARRYDLLIANVFHAGDGNLHPLSSFDAQRPGDVEKAIAAGADILRACVRRGGSISGEHGIGIEKRDCMGEQYGSADLALMAKLKSAFNPLGLCNPGKMFPTSRRCGEAARTLASQRLPAEVAAAAGPAF